MAEKPYKWLDGAFLEEHSRCKHKLLRDYFFQYLIVRCQLPKRTSFRLAVVDGFAGAGRYADGSAGSPVIFVEELRRASEFIAVERAAQGFPPLVIDCYLVLNDADLDAISALERRIAPMQVEIGANCPGLNLRVDYLNATFEFVYPKIKEAIKRGKYHNAIFNLDQCGYSHVEQTTLTDIMESHRSVEIFYTFAIEALLAFLEKTNPDRLKAQLLPFGLEPSGLAALAEGGMSKKTWLGAAESLVFEALRKSAKFVSPFAINNPNGWRYWLIHLAKVSRARQVYNDLLHQNSTAQAHFGRSGLKMLSYDPSHEGALYLFTDSDRREALDQLYTDIPRLIEGIGSEIRVDAFYEKIYNETPAHSDDIRRAIIQNPDIEVLTPVGGERRSEKAIDEDDVIRLKPQTRLYSVLPSAWPKEPGRK